MVGEDQKDEQHLETDGRDSEEVDGHQVLDMVVQESSPGRRRAVPGAHAIFLHPGLGHVDAELGQFTNDARGAPVRVGAGEAANDCLTLPLRGMPGFDRRQSPGQASIRKKRRSVEAAGVVFATTTKAV